MKEWIIRVDGMMCSMCEAHVNDAIRRHVSVKKVVSSHSKGEVRVVADDSNGRHAPGSVSFVPQVTGLILAGEVIKDIAGGRTFDEKE